MLQEIDFWLLGRLERFSHWWQKLTGKNCFWLARACAVFYGLVLMLWMLFLTFKTKGLAAYFSFGILILFAFTITIFSVWNIKFKEQLVAEFPGFSNPFKIIDSGVRIIAMLIMPICSLPEIIDLLNGKFSVVLIFIGVFGNALFWYVFMFYFSACDPLPPGKSKIKAWKEKLAGAVKNVFSPAPRPAPQPQKA